MRTIAIVSFSVIAFAVPSLCRAATHYLWTPVDPVTDYAYDELRIEIHDGGSYEVPIGANGTGRVRIDDPNTNPPFANGRGEAYYVPDPENPLERESVGSAGNLAFEREGTYEIDAFARSISAAPQSNFFAWLVPTAHAQAEDPLYVDTIRFSITHGPALVAPCCSSVLFLPGMQGSVLSSNGNTLWPPSVWSDDVPELALDSDGTSVNPVRVDGVLEGFYGVPVYEGFVDFMDELVNAGIGVNDWRAFAYDWRYPLDKVIRDGVETPDGTVFVVDEIENLASESNTGKVTIVAHSMGGLLGKAVIKELMERGEEDLIDAFIMVGTPQLGTPQGAAALLHGDDQAIPGGFWLGTIIVDPSDARSVAQNFESAYSLLPSEAYFAEVATPVITFATSAPFTNAWRTQWGSSIDMYSEFKDFATGASVPRTDPSADLTVPEVLNPSIFQNASDWHSEFDRFQIPSSIRVVQIAGWGLPTVKTVDYRLEHGKQNYEVLFTKEGDGTVVYPSAISSDTQTYFFNIFDYNELPDPDVQHRDLISAYPVENLIKYLLTGDNQGDSEYVSTDKPLLTDIGQQILISTHSPVAVGAYDSHGQFTGIDSSQNLASGLMKVSQEIPGSFFTSVGKDQYLFLPKSGSYQIKIKGTGSGPATIETATVFSDTVTKSASYTDVPVTEATVAELMVTASEPQGAVLNVDANGDGQIDSIVTPDNYAPTVGQLFAELKLKVSELKFKNKLLEKVLKRSLTSRIEQLEKRISKIKGKRANLQIVLLGKQIFWLSKTKLVVEGDVNAILSLIGHIEKQL